MERGLDSFFSPKSIAVVGASNTPGKVGHILMEKLSKFKGDVVPINPKDSKVNDIKAYPSLLDCKKKIDLVVIAIPKRFVSEVMLQVVEKKIKNVILITAGFAEVGDVAAEEEIVKIARDNGINLLGPNCFGLINAKEKIDLTFSKETVKHGDTVFISQSGALGSYVLDLDIGLRGFISVGNMSDLNFPDFIEFFSKDRATKKIVLYIEALKDGRRFIDACKKSKKEIVVVKSGKTKAGVKATMSHTGSLATDFEVYKGAFKQAGVKYMISLAEAFGFEKQDYSKFLKGKNIAVITNAGGAGALVTDELERDGFVVHGPKDILGTATPNDYKRALHKIKNPYSNIIVIFTPQTMSDATQTAKIIAQSRWKDKIVALFLGDESVREAKKILKDNKILCFTRAV
jgi:acyl-CoA synthetase (NDP forming)